MNQVNITQVNLRNYKNTDLINVFKHLSDDAINAIDKNIIDRVARLNSQTINTIFRNARPLLQSKLWSNQLIQQVLILGSNQDKNLCREDIIRNLECLHKEIKSPSIKKQIYKNSYFIKVIIQNNYLDDIFFHDYDINKVLEGIIFSQEFNSLPSDQQLAIIGKLNKYSKEILLPVDFRKRYSSIKLLLPEIKNKKFDDKIMMQLTEDEILFLDYINGKTTSKQLKEYIIDNIKNKHKSFDEFFESLQENTRIASQKVRGYYLLQSLEDEFYQTILSEIRDEIIIEKLLKHLLGRILKNSSVNPENMYNTLKRNIYNNLLNYRDINYLTSNQEDVTNDLKLTFYLKFNIALSNARYLYGITSEQLSKVNIKHINKLAKFLEDKTQDELAAIYSLSIKIYFIFGYERSIEILSGKFGKYNRRFLDNVAKTDVSKVKMVAEGNKYLPVIDKRFMNFMFDNPKNNHFINMFNNKDSELYKMWYYLYNNYDEILEKCHHEITLKKVNTILATEKYDIDRKMITPEHYLLDNNSLLENIILGNKTNYHNNEILKTFVDIYAKMKKRIEASIPYIKGMAESGYKYEMMKLDDPQIFELGYKADCCIRTLDIAHNHLLHAALCRNGRILIIYNQSNEVAAFCPLKRNGNVLIANSIELVDKNISATGKLISDAFNAAVIKIVTESKQSDEPINLVCIGSYSHLKSKTTPFPKTYPTPTIFEKNDKVYRYTDAYHKTLDIVYMDSDFSFKNIQAKDPEVSYMDPREEIKYCNLYTDRHNNEGVLKLINAINYSTNPNNYTPVNEYLISSVYYSKDWYIANTYEGIIGAYLENDYRAQEEFNTYMSIIKNDNQKTLTKKISLPPNG